MQIRDFKIGITTEDPWEGTGVEANEDDKPTGHIHVVGMPIWKFPVTESGWFCSVEIDGQPATKADLENLLFHMVLPLSDLNEDGTANIQLPYYLDALLPNPDRGEATQMEYDGGTMKIEFTYDSKNIVVDIEFDCH